MGSGALQAAAAACPAHSSNCCNPCEVGAHPDFGGIGPNVVVQKGEGAGIRLGWAGRRYRLDEQKVCRWGGERGLQVSAA